MTRLAAEVQPMLVALLWSAIASVATWLITIPLRRRSLVGLLSAVVLTGVAASIGAVLGAVHTMLIPVMEQTALVAVTGITGVVATAAAAVSARRLARDNAEVRGALLELAEGRIPETGGRRLSSELQRLRDELSATALTLAQARERERALEAARRELVAFLSHDLRTPLAGLRAMSEALEDGVVVDPHLYYKQINASVGRLSAMVDDLFDLSRIQAGSSAREVESIGLDDLVSDCLAGLQPLAAARGVRLTGQVRAPAAVTGNGGELNRALTNLVANAIRHTRASGTVDVRVGLTRESSQPRAEVVVRDECGGIAAADLARVFDVGYRGETARTPTRSETARTPTRSEAGAGLGLAITRGIVEAHSGTVDVLNSAQGCTFRVLLPVAPAAPVAPVGT